MEKENILRHDTVSMDEQTGELVIIDQTRLPGETVFLRLSRPEEIHEAIYKLRVRGAPAIGVAAAIGIYAACRHLPEDSLHFLPLQGESLPRHPQKGAQAPFHPAQDLHRVFLPLRMCRLRWMYLPHRESDRSLPLPAE